MVEARKLLHWVNSLPPPACLLVGELRELRFGDVLLTVARWVEDGVVVTASEREEEEGGGNARLAALARLRRVLRFVAAEVRCEDRDALYVVNEAQCAERLWRGDADVFCAVLRVLKRVGDEREAREWAEREKKEEREHALASRQVEAALAELRASNRAVLSASGVRREVSTSRNAPPDERVCATAASTRTSEGDPGHRPSRRRTTAVGLKSCTALRPKTTTSRHCDAESFRERKVPTRRDDSGQLHVYSMVDPLALRLPNARKSAAEPGAEEPKCAAGSVDAALRVRGWMSSLGIVLARDRFFPKQHAPGSIHPARSVRSEFEDGVLLCRLAAAIVRKRGSEEDREQLHTYAKASVAMPRGGTLHPQNAAERRNNVVVAAHILAKFCGLGGNKRGREETCAELVSFFTARRSPRERGSVWDLLDRVRAGIDASVAPDTVSDTPPRRSAGEPSRFEIEAARGETKPNRIGDENANAVANTTLEAMAMPRGKRRSYITSEQMGCVNQWLACIGNDILENRGRGLLEDPLRNGVLLCNAYNRAFLLPDTPSLCFTKAPKTLLEVRQNFVKAFERLRSLKKLQLPSSYLKSSSWEAMIMGDRQVTYGILWCLWQFAQELNNQSRKAGDCPPVDTRKEQPLEQSSEPQDSSLLHPPLHASEAKRGCTPAVHKKAKVLSKVCPLLIDIPAAVLASGERNVGTIEAGYDDFGGEDRVHSVDTLWRCEQPFEDDLFPQPSRMQSEPTPRVHIAKPGSPVPFKANLVAADRGFDAVASVKEAAHESIAASTRCVPDPVVQPVSPEDRLEEVQQQPPEPSPSVQAEETSPPLNDVTVGKVSQNAGSPPPKVVEDRLATRAEVSDDVVREILAWLGHLKIRLTPSAPLTEFQSGVLLCSVVEKVEFMRCLPGVCAKPGPSKANALHNISKALGILQQKKTMPLHLLRRKSEIYGGNRSVILELLSQIRKAYGYHHQSSALMRKAKKRSSKPSEEHCA